MKPEQPRAAASGPMDGHLVERLSRVATEWSGRTQAFVSAVGIVALWALLGPYFKFSDTWQLVINTGTTIVTFLMVFLIQRAQNNDSRAVHLKLNEIVAALHGASNRLIDAEELSESELAALHERYVSLAAQIGKRRGRQVASVEEVGVRPRT